MTREELDHEFGFVNELMGLTSSAPPLLDLPLKLRLLRLSLVPSNRGKTVLGAPVIDILPSSRTARWYM